MRITEVRALLNREERHDFRRLLALLVMASLTESLGLALVLPYILVLQDPGIITEQPIYQWAFSGWGSPSPNQIILLATFFLFLAICLKFSVQAWSNYHIAHFPYRVFSRLSQELFQKYLNANFLHITKNNSSIQVKTLVSSTEMTGNAILIWLQFHAHILMIGALSLVIAIQCPEITMILILTFGILGCGVYRLFRKKQAKAGEAKEEAQGLMYQRAAEAIHSIKEIQLYRKSSYFGLYYGESCIRFGQAMGDSMYYPLLPVVFVESLAIVMILIGIIVAISYEIALGSLVPYLIFFGVAGRRLLPSVYQAVSFRVTLQRLQPSVLILQKEIETLKKWQLSSVPPLPAMESELEFQDISFKYTEQKWAVRNINLTLRKNQSVAFVGPSGAGKSTLIELLTGLLEPQRGTYFYDGKQIASMRGIQPQLGYVPQMVQLVDGSIRANIAFGDLAPDDEKVWLALTLAHLYEFVIELPDKIDAKIGEKGLQLSGGQRQRLGIARALYRNPEIIIFDEATASLDSIAEQMVSDNIREMMGSKTIIAVAHRLSTIRNFDQIYVMDQGQIIATGTHKELLRNCPLYAQLNQTQPTRDPITNKENFLKPDYQMEIQPG